MTPIELQAKATEVLRDAAEFVEMGWCQGMLARDAFGNEEIINDGDDVAWCAMGAILKAAEHQTNDYLEIRELDRAATERLIRVTNTACSVGVGRWNDIEGRTAEEVAEALREAAGVK